MMRKQTTKGFILLTAILLFSLSFISARQTLAAAEKNSKQIYKKNNCIITFKQSEKGKNRLEGQFIIQNNSGITIENWQFSFSFTQKITSVTNAEIASHKGNQYILLHTSKNSSIPDGGKVVIEWKGKLSGNIKLPTKCTLKKVEQVTKQTDKDTEMLDQMMRALQKVHQLLSEMQNEDAALIIAEIKKIEGIKQVTQNGYYLTITFDSGITSEVMIMTEDNPLTQPR